MRLMCSLFLSGHQSYLSGDVARLMVRTRHQNDTCYDEIRLCAQNIHTVLGSIGYSTSSQLGWSM